MYTHYREWLSNVKMTTLHVFVMDSQFYWKLLMLHDLLSKLGKVD